MENFGILTPGDSNFDLSQKMTEVISKWFSRAFERCLSFFSTATRSRDHGGGAFKRPPPSRRWEIQRPSRARVKINILKFWKMKCIKIMLFSWWSQPYAFLKGVCLLHLSSENIFPVLHVIQTLRVYYSRWPISWLIPEMQYPVIHIIKFSNKIKFSAFKH